MGTPVIADPASCEAVHRDDVSAVERWASGQRAELVRLTAELRRILDEPPQERRVDEPAIGAGEAIDDSQLAVVDTMLTAAARRLDAVVEAARTEAEAVVADAVRQAATLLRSVGAHEATIDRAPAHRPLPEPQPWVPRDGAQLQRELTARAVLCTPARIAAPRADAPTIVDLDATPGDASPGDLGAVDVGAVDARLGDLGAVDVGAVDASHELFWGGGATDAPVRERFRRWAQWR